MSLMWFGIFKKWWPPIPNSVLQSQGEVETSDVERDDISPESLPLGLGSATRGQARDSAPSSRASGAAAGAVMSTKPRWCWSAASRERPSRLAARPAVAEL
jgi:hypothetical protein